MQFSEKRGRSVIISVTSLIDVMFLLLIFLMVTSTFYQQPGMKLDLPSAQSTETTVTHRLILFIDADNRLILDNRPVSIDSLEVLIAKAAASSEDGTLVLNADKTVQHGVVVRVMDIAKRAGMKRLVVGTKDEGR